MVNRGFVPEGPERDPASRAEGQVGIVDIVGALRWPEPRGTRSAPTDNPARRLWFVRDHLAIAEAKGWGAVAPFYIDQEAPPPPGGLPKAGPLRRSLPNNHLQYALTWFGLAGCAALRVRASGCGQRFAGSAPAVPPSRVPCAARARATRFRAFPGIPTRAVHFDPGRSPAARLSST